MQHLTVETRQLADRPLHASSMRTCNGGRHREHGHSSQPAAPGTPWSALVRSLRWLASPEAEIAVAIASLKRSAPHHGPLTCEQASAACVAVRQQLYGRCLLSTLLRRSDAVITDDKRSSKGSFGSCTDTRSAREAAATAERMHRERETQLCSKLLWRAGCCRASSLPAVACEGAGDAGLRRWTPEILDEARGAGAISVEVRARGLRPCAADTPACFLSCAQQQSLCTPGCISKPSQLFWSRLCLTCCQDERPRSPSVTRLMTSRSLSRDREDQLLQPVGTVRPAC